MEICRKQKLFWPNDFLFYSTHIHGSLPNQIWWVCHFGYEISKKLSVFVLLLLLTSKLWIGILISALKIVLTSGSSCWAFKFVKLFLVFSIVIWMIAIWLFFASTEFDSQSLWISCLYYDDIWNKVLITK